MRRVSLLELQALKEEKGDFILYVRSDRARERISEVFDTDVVVPELEKSFRLDFFSINADEEPDVLKEFPLPSLILFKDGKVVHVLRGIKNWNEYVKAITETYF